MPNIKIKSLPKGNGKVEFTDDFFGTIYDAENDYFENEVNSFSEERKSGWNRFVESIHADHGACYSDEEK